MYEVEALLAAGVLAPVFLLLAVGWALRRVAFVGDAFWQPAERLTYFLLFPALIGAKLAQAELAGAPWLGMAVAIAASIGLLSAALLALRPMLGIEGPRFTSLLQGSIRMNTYVGLSIAGGLGDVNAAAYAAVAIAVIVPLVNLVCVVALARYGASPAASKQAILRAIAGNPLIVASLVGALLNVSGFGLPPVLGPTAEALGRAALPMGLLAVGASLDLPALRRAGVTEALISAGKLLVLPAITAVLLRTLGVTGSAATVAVLFTALPTAPSSYLLARQLGGDAASMTSLITVQTVAAAVTLPFVLGYFV